MPTRYSSPGTCSSVGFCIKAGTFKYWLGGTIYDKGGCITNTITNDGLINVNWADVKSFSEYALGDGKIGYDILGTDGSTQCITDL